MDDNDIRWSDAQENVGNHNQKRRHARHVNDNSSDSDTESHGGGNILAAQMQFKHGHFKCQIVWQKSFALHPRLRISGSKNRGCAGYLTCIDYLDHLKVKNRPNYYAISEHDTQRIFYFKITCSNNSSDGEIKAHQLTLDENHENIKLSATQNPSHFAIALQRTNTLQNSKAPSSSSGMSDPESMHGISQSQKSLTPSQKNKPEDKISLEMFGIHEPGKNLTLHLVENITKKLDEATLDQILNAFKRNPGMNLAQEDVHFIQKPESQPIEQIYFFFPTAALFHQFAFGIYLRQNLQTVVLIPRCESGFQDFTKKPAVPILESNIFLYTSPEKAGSKGIACIQLSFVDGKGVPVQLLNSPKPKRYSYKEFGNQSDYSVFAERYFPDPNSKNPGPSSLIKFSVWQCGTVDIGIISEKLSQAVKHAVLDLMIEFQLLTAPLCEPPHQKNKWTNSPRYSAPVTPNYASAEKDGTSCGDDDVASRQMARYIEQRPTTARESHMSFDSILTEAIHMPTSKSVQTIKEINVEEVNCSWMRRIQMYEKGECGMLNTIFINQLPKWFDFCSKNKLPSISTYKYHLESYISMGTLLSQLHSILAPLTLDMTLAAFKEAKFHQEGIACNDRDLVASFLPFDFQILAQMLEQTLNYPQQSCNYILIGRNVDQWRQCLEDEDDASSHQVIVSQPPLTPKSQRKVMRFPSFDDESRLRLDLGAFSSLLDTISPKEKVYVPRQKILLIFCRQKTLDVFAYNWTNEHSKELDQRLQSHVCWLNARNHLLTCIALQKMGLFRHQLIYDPPPHLDDTNKLETSNSYLNSNDLENLIKHPTYLNVISKIRARTSSAHLSRTTSVSSHILLPIYDGVYRNAKVSVAMHKCPNLAGLDLLGMHGTQAMQLSVEIKKDTEKMEKLQYLYDECMKRNIQHIFPMESIVLLKNSSHLLHHVMSPLIFSPSWHCEHITKKIVSTTTLPQSNSQNHIFDRNQKSRHSSGASSHSQRLGGTNSDQKKRPPITSSPSVESNLGLISEDGHWVAEVSEKLSEQYCAYLVAIGFMKINLKENQKKIGHPEEKQPIVEAQIKVDTRPTVYLQKTFQSGIILMEIGFLCDHIYANLYAFESTRLSIPFSQNMNLMFADECDKLKDLTHLNSFNYDFHLWLLYGHLTQKHDLLPATYPTHSMLQFLLLFFDKPPIYAWNWLREESVNLLSSAVTAKQLFDYMIQTSNVHLLKSVETMLFNSDSFSVKKENILVQALDANIFENCYFNNSKLAIHIVLLLGPEEKKIDYKFWLLIAYKEHKFPKNYSKKKKVPTATLR